jgi:uncharacterized lipoprotein YmbA
MKAFFFTPKMIAVLILGLALTGCLTKASAPTNFYMLTPLTPPAVNPSTVKGQEILVIVVDSVQVPGYIDRNQIVTRLNDTEYQLAEFNQWTESISGNLTRVIAENLSRLLVSDAADVFPSARSILFDYRIEVEVLRLDGKLGDRVMLMARWMIFGAEEDDLIVLRKSEYQEKTEDGSYKGLVLAQSRAVEKLSRDIAAAMKKTLANPSKR